MTPLPSPSVPINVASAHAMLVASPDVVWGVDAAGRIRAVNRETILVPTGAFASVGSSVYDCIPPEAHEGWNAAVARALAGDPMAETLLSYEDRCWSARIRRAPSGTDGIDIVCTIRDITASAARARAAEAAAFRYEVLAEVTGSVVYERPIDSESGAVSPSMRAVFGYDADLARAAGVNWWLERVHEDDQQIVRSRFADHRPGYTTRWNVEYRVQRSDGSWAIVQDQGRTIDATDTMPARAVGIITDVTQVRALQAQLQHSQRLEMVGRLAAGVAHDFNNVLSAIGGFTEELLAATPERDPRHEDLTQVSALVERAAGLTRNLLGLTRPRQVGQSRLVNVSQELQRLVPTLRILVGSRLELRLDAEDLQVSTPMDPALFDQVILNLAANARDATPDGGRIELRVSSTGSEQSPRVRVDVRDTGSGIPAHVLQRVFEPFFTTKGERRGTGLGLWLVREIVEGAGGTVSVDSSPQEGTVVTLDLPASAEPPSADPEKKKARRQAALPPDRTALLIEDEEPVRHVTRRILERSGYRVIEAEVGTDGLRILEEQRESIDVIITDLHMPGIQGSSLVQRIRDVAPEVGCLVVSGLAERFAGLVDNRDAIDVLGKPWDTETLVRRVSSLADGTIARRSRAN